MSPCSFLCLHVVTTNTCYLLESDAMCFFIICHNRKKKTRSKTSTQRSFVQALCKRIHVWCCVDLCPYRNQTLLVWWNPSNRKDCVSVLSSLSCSDPSGWHNPLLFSTNSMQIPISSNTGAANLKVMSLIYTIFKRLLQNQVKHKSKYV